MKAKPTILEFLGITTFIAAAMAALRPHSSIWAAVILVLILYTERARDLDVSDEWASGDPTCPYRRYGGTASVAVDGTNQWEEGRDNVTSSGQTAGAARGLDVTSCPARA